MLAELDRLVRLQRLETATAEAQEAIAALPAERAALDARLAASTAALDEARRTVAEHKAARLQAEKDLAEVQKRLDKYKGQLMEVKTNEQFRAMQKEIETAQDGVARFEDKVLEEMLQGDELAAAVAEAERALAEAQAEAAAARAALDERERQLQAQVERRAGERAALVGELPAEAAALFETLARGRKGLAVTEARDGRCTSCQVRLRPQLFNDVRLNRSLIQCESCQRILYFHAEPAPAAARPPS